MISMDRFEVESHWGRPKGVRQINIYWVKDTVSGQMMILRQNDGRGWLQMTSEETAERLVREYECEEFFTTKDLSYLATLTKFVIDIVQSTTRLRGEMELRVFRPTPELQRGNWRYKSLLS